MNPETHPTPAIAAPVAAQPAPAPIVSSPVTPTAPVSVTLTAPKPAAPRAGKKQRSAKHAPAL